jgi:hypothetical protein
LNAQRKLLTDQVFQGALIQIEKDPTLLNYAALVLSHPSWPAGVIGIVASRLVSRFNKPVVLIATDSAQAETGSGRGSARSIPGINITTALNQNQDLLENFGGHPMAAGLSIQATRIPEFRRHLSRTIQEMAGEGVLEATLQIDGYLSLSELSLTLVEDLERLAPFGPGNPPLTQASRGLKLQNHSPIGRNGEHLQLIVEDEAGSTQKVVWWQGAGWPLPGSSFDLAYTVRASTYRGLRDVQVTWLEARQPEIQPSRGGSVILTVDGQATSCRHPRRPTPTTAACWRCILSRSVAIMVSGEFLTNVIDFSSTIRSAQNSACCRKRLSRRIRSQTICRSTSARGSCSSAEIANSVGRVLFLGLASRGDII